MEKLRLHQLFELYYTGQATEDETNQLMLLLKDLPDEEIAAIFHKTWDEQDESQRFSNPELREKLLNKIHREELPGAKVYPIQNGRRRLMVKIAAAAVFVFMLSVTAYFLTRRERVEISHTPPTPVTNDINPGGNRALLTLADGSQIVLDSAANGRISQQGNTQIIKLDDGQLAYNAAAGTSEVLYNTISTPRGGQYQVVLPDGSKVWLNAASSLRFPSTFSGRERNVELTGEAYFEIAKNAKMPFKVAVREMEVEVLGTHFNVNSYNDEPAIKTTLVEGAVNIRIGLSHQVMAAGQQVQVDNRGLMKLIKEVDTEEAIAWKNGKFIFSGINIQSVMRQLEKWYDIEVEYKGDLTKEEFVGMISRSSNISQILQMLEKTRAVNFEINGRKVIVK